MEKKVKKQLYLFGYGKTTCAIAKEFRINKVYDDRELVEKRCFHSSKFPKKPKKDSYLIPAPGVPPTNEVFTNFKGEVISEYDLFYLEKKFPFSIWVSGTNGKTTTTEMITLLLKERYAESGGNIGTPLGKMSSDSSIWVLETSSFTLHYTKHAKPNIYILLPIKDDHADWHGSFEKYVESKLKPLKTLREGEVAIIPEEFADVESDGYIISYKNSEDLAKKLNLDSSKIDFNGAFLLDALLALATSKILFDEVDYEKINSYKMLPHRQEKILDFKSRIWINDSKATNVDSTIALLENFKDEKLYLILGGDDKDADFKPLFEILKEKRVEVFGIGKSISMLSNFSKEFNIPFVKSETLEQAISQISKKHSKKSLAILSPACASKDQFKSYIERGEIFKKVVNEIE
jgi:UDP-N-acetylmuramoylalanine--D-glutamate ligase